MGTPAAGTPVVDAMDTPAADTLILEMWDEELDPMEVEIPDAAGGCEDATTEDSETGYGSGASEPGDEVANGHGDTSDSQNHKVSPMRRTAPRVERVEPERAPRRRWDDDAAWTEDDVVPPTSDRRKPKRPLLQRANGTQELDAGSKGIRLHRPWWGIRKNPNEQTNYRLVGTSMHIDRSKRELMCYFQLVCDKGEPRHVEYEVNCQTIREISHFGTGATSVHIYHLFRSFYDQVLRRGWNERNLCRTIVRFTLWSEYSKLRSATRLLENQLNTLTPTTHSVLFEHDMNGHEGPYPKGSYTSKVNYTMVLKHIDD